MFSLLNPFKFLSSFVVICVLLAVIVLTYDSDYLPEPVEEAVFGIQNFVEEASETWQELFDS